MNGASEVAESTVMTCGIHIPETPVPRRIHDEGHMLFWQARGSSCILVDGAPYRLAAGQALWVPSGTPHHGTVHGNSVLIPMLFYATEFATTQTTPRKVTVDPSLETLLLARIQWENSLIRPRSEVSRQILTVVEGGPGTDDDLRTPTSPPARQVADILRLDPGDPRSISEFAATVHVSVRTLQRMFVEETGTDFRHWRLRNRMASAGDLLRSGASVGAVARRLGYRDTSSFSRAFRTATGVSPSGWCDRSAPSGQ